MTASELQFETRLLSSLTKVFPDQELEHTPFERFTALRGETFAFQAAYRTNHLLKDLRARVDSKLAPWIQLRSVGLAPSELPCYADHDGDVLRSTPGLFPDPLYPVGNANCKGLPNQWRSVWVTVDLADSNLCGAYPIHIVFETGNGERLSAERFELEVLPVELPEQRLIHTEWFHADCLATHYQVEVFSEAHWARIEQFVECAVRHGVNMLLTPLFTPPLDTKPGGERPTVQLVDVDKAGGDYRFGFDKLTRWIQMCSRLGIQYFEFSHLFTQWGARHAPKILAMENGSLKRIFGWETDAAGEAYESFLSQFLPALDAFITQQGLKNRVYFHVSDEPGKEHLDSYADASRILSAHLSGYPVIDALSDYSFYERGLVRGPIPASNHIGEFLEREVPQLWTYYCCSQYKKVSNRFFAFSSARNRVIGLQLYKYNIRGFLHWGFNFWYAQYSVRAIDPYRVTDADQAFPSGDAFLVYPGVDGPVESIRLEVFYEALQDLRALTLLERYIGREQVLAIMEDGLHHPITFDEYPNDEAWLLSVRERVNARIAECFHR